MNKKFYRENNALSIKDATLIVPSPDELLMLLIDKLIEKTEQIKVINNKQMREKYLKNKNKYEQSLTMPEFRVKQLLTERVCIDVYELLQTIAKLKNIKLKTKETYKYKDTIIANKMQNALNDNIITNLPLLFDLLQNLCSNYNFNLKNIEIMQKQIKKKEGSFEKGLIIITKDN